MFPPSLLNKVYVQKSLKNTPTGFEFTLKNLVDSGTLTGIPALTVDGAVVPLESVALQTSTGEKRAGEINPRAPLPVWINAQITVRVAGQPLAEGQHQIKLALSIMEAGRLEITIDDAAG
jgi:hydroxymethylglutaryl-CoA reductase (NADPH)